MASTKPEITNPFTHDAQGLKYDPTVDPKDRYAGDNGCQSCDYWPWALRFACGVFLTLNFVIFWSVPIYLQGIIWRGFLCPFLRPIYQWMDNNKTLRSIGEKYVFTRPRHADYFVQLILCFASFFPPFLYMLHQQITNGTLSWGQIIFYNFCWVGIRGGTLGGVYSLAHREGHTSTFYRPWIRNSIGNIFENFFGPFFGNVPYNFTTTHNYLHHALQARSADSFYQYDVDRTSWVDFMILLHRIAMHTNGIAAWNQMRLHGLKKQSNILLKGIFQYYFIYPAIILAITRSWSFLFFMYVQPYVGMTFFLAFMNVAFHAFVDYDETGNPVECVYSTELLGGDDDYFGEDSHFTHHVAGHVYWRDFAEYRPKMYADFAKYHGAVFEGLSVVEAAAFMLFKQWDMLADHFVQFNDEPAPNKLPSEELIRRGQEDLSAGVKQSVWVGQGRLTKKEVAVMLETRAKRREPKWLRCELLVNESAASSFEH